MRAKKWTPIPAAEYLANEVRSTVRHEYVAGQVYALAGGTRRHNRIAGNAYVALTNHLRGRPCQVSMADVKLHVARADVYYYPDVLVTCGDQGAVADGSQVVEDATLVIEVRSPTTEAIDEREKLQAYRRLPGLQEYVLIAQDRHLVEVYRREGDVGWLYVTYEPGDAVEWASVGLTVPMAALYEGTDAPER